MSTHPRSTCPVHTFSSWRGNRPRTAFGSAAGGAALEPGRQALLALAHLRRGDTYTRLAAGFGVGLATVCRHIHEAVQPLAALAPDLADALKVASRKAHVILDGTLSRIDRIAADRPYYSGKHKRHGMNVQVLADPAGRLPWASPALPGSAHDLTAARTHGIIEALNSHDIPCWADKVYRGAGGSVRVPYRGKWHNLSPGQQAVNRSHARIRALGERSVSILKTWRLPRRLRCSTTHITTLPSKPYEVVEIVRLHPTRNHFRQPIQACTADRKRISMKIRVVADEQPYDVIIDAFRKWDLRNEGIAVLLKYHEHPTHRPHSRPGTGPLTRPLLSVSDLQCYDRRSLGVSPSCHTSQSRHAESPIRK
ncbi:DDE superfamily endonuclease [Saccharothrix australiensis]|uniref:DDE superfamily endonuclease n=1 Tax=Saccharothrix australiensis TaxID=2072 RepID=A0A495W2U7_9PSEU|nr:DDE superfamily endonuclease [Saccharothrix australiensis]